MYVCCGSLRILPLLLLGLGLLSSGCGKSPVVDAGEYAPYVDRFAQESQRQGAAVTISDLRVVSSDSVPDGDTAVCDQGGGMTPTVSVNSARWATLSEMERETVLFHELGHCVLKRAHETARGSDGEPVSVMYPVRVDATVYRDNRDAYLHELFSRHDELKD